MIPGGLLILASGDLPTYTFDIVTASSADFRTLALAAGWNGTSAAILRGTVPTGNIISSTTTSLPSLTIAGSFPAESEIYLTNNGTIVGMGAAGGRGIGEAGAAGGTALSVSVGAEVSNTGTIAGGGGGGGGGQRAYNPSIPTKIAAGGGGGGAQSGLTNSAGAPAYCIGGTYPNCGGAGSYGSYSVPGPGGAGGNSTVGQFGGGGGTGGSWGQPGSLGGAAILDSGSAAYGIRGPGGAAGAAVSGDANITWNGTGTRLGTIG